MVRFSVGGSNIDFLIVDENDCLVKSVSDSISKCINDDIMKNMVNLNIDNNVEKSSQITSQDLLELHKNIIENMKIESKPKVLLLRKNSDIKEVALEISEQIDIVGFHVIYHQLYKRVEIGYGIPDITWKPVYIIGNSNSDFTGLKIDGILNTHKDPLPIEELRAPIQKEFERKLKKNRSQIRKEKKYKSRRNTRGQLIRKYDD